MPPRGLDVFCLEPRGFFEMNVLDHDQRTSGPKTAKNKRIDANGGDTQKYYQSVEFIVDYITKAHDPELAGVFVDTLIDRLREAGMSVPPSGQHPIH